MSAGVMGAVLALLRQGHRPQARACAHEALDRGDAEGLAAAALVASRERFHRLAWALLERLDPLADDGLLHSLRLEAAWKLGLAQSPRLQTHLLGPEQLAALLEVAIECHRTADMARLAAPLAQQPGAYEPRARQVQSWLGRLGNTMRDPTPAQGHHRIVVATLPPALGAGEGTADRLVQRWRKAVARGKRSWFGLRSSPESSSARFAIDCLHAASGRLGEIPPGSLVLLLDGLIDRHNACHWRDALVAWPKVLMAGLRVHDPAALLDGQVRDALLAHAPIGARDWSSWYLLRDHGIGCYLSGGLEAVSAVAAPLTSARLWSEGEDAPLLAQTMDTIDRALRDGGSFDVETLRAAWPSQSAEPAYVNKWLEAGPANDESAPMRHVGTHATPWPADAMHVAMAVDTRLAEAALVAIESCRMHASLPLCVHLLTRDIDEATQSEWHRRFAGQLNLQIHPCDEVHHGDGLHLISHTSESTLDRLLLPQLLPTLERVIYLDVDLVVLNDLEPLWRLPLGDKPLAAKPSSSPGTEWGTQMIYHALSALPEGDASAWRHSLHERGSLRFRAFNAGVLVLNLEQMRRDRATELMLQLVRRAAMNDQDALNWYAGSRYLALDAEWNAAPRQDPTAKAKIVHFVGPVKPWHELYISRKDEYERIRLRLQQQWRRSDDS